MGASGSYAAKPECAIWAVPSKQHWKKVKESLEKEIQIKSVNDVEKWIEQLHGRKSSMCGLQAALDDHYDAGTDVFFTKVFPYITGLALKLPALLENAHCCADTKGKGIDLLLQNKPGCLKLPRKVVASLMANLFLGILPTSEDRPFQVNMEPLLSSPSHAEQEIAKIRCFLNYFQRLSEMEQDIKGFLYVRRQQLSEPYDWKSSDVPLCEVEVIKDGGIEDSVGSLQIDFANCHLGGGVIEGGCVQEEIRFSINPELTCAMLFCENMTDLEAIVLTGAERFSNYNGYGSSLRFGGNHVDETERNEDGTVCTSIAAIDAMSYYGQFENLLKLQLTPENMARDANKALAGVKDFSSDESELECSKSKFESVATGNWGCGAFEGNIHVKFLIQWCAVSVSGRLMKYYTFEKEQASTGEMMKALAQGLTAKKVTVGDLWQIMEKLGEIANGEGDQCNVIPAVGKHFEIDIPFEGEIPDIPST